LWSARAGFRLVVWSKQQVKLQLQATVDKEASSNVILADVDRIQRPFECNENTFCFFASLFSTPTMPRIEPLLPEQTEGEMLATLQGFFRKRGNVPNMFRTMALRPDIALLSNKLMGAIVNTGTLDTKLKEMAIVRTSRVNGCVY
jgi:hypothetical protein